ncbi:MAG: DUF2589 domain-containing protein [Lysobacteraceae bacterium]|nr:MAG: DUF2589 domain-containing protein [Xanthomonadaceae bacterium]
MPNLVQELNSLDFNVYIGGPLQAAVQAQHAASMSLVSFIQEVGFKQVGTDTELRYVDFEYTKTAPNPTTGAMEPTHVLIKVPFLTMLVLPALRIEEITIDFNAKLTSTETSNVSSEFAGAAELSMKFWKVNFKATASYKRSTSTSSNIEKTYNLGVHVRAVNDELPAGLDRILTILENSIVGA